MFTVFGGILSVSAPRNIEGGGIDMRATDFSLTELFLKEATDLIGEGLDVMLLDKVF